MTTDLIKLSAPATSDFWKIPILYEDAHLLALDKPSQLLTSPDRYDPERPNLMKLLHRDLERGAAWAKKRNLTYLMNAHRLDFETSGVILLAKDKPTLIALANLFGAEKPVKQYLALVRGEPTEQTFTVAAKLAPHPHNPARIRVDEKQGKRAITRFEVRERFREHTLLDCYPQTGRTHQIRVHLQSARLPLVGDAVYGGTPLLLSRLKPDYRLKPGRTERPLIGRTALHAIALTLPHPVSGAPVEITAPWAHDIEVGVKYLRRLLPL